MKDCEFQYATANGSVMVSTGLIIRADAEELWVNHVNLFKSHVLDGREPEMAVWIDMDHAGDYKKTSSHWCASDFEVRDGKLYKIELVA